MSKLKNILKEENSSKIMTSIRVVAQIGADFDGESKVTGRVAIAGGEEKWREKVKVRGISAHVQLSLQLCILSFTTIILFMKLFPFFFKFLF